MTFRALFLLVLCFLCLVDVSAYSSGNIDSACDSMVPPHGGSAQTDNTSYTISVSKSTYTPNEQLTVTLSGATGQEFKGFLIQARSDISTTTTYGSFNYPNGTHNPCTSQSAVSHTDGAVKSSIEVTWTAPSTDSGNIVFVYTVVETKLTYWVKLTSAPITYDGAMVAPTQSSSPSTQQTTQSSVPQPTSSSTSIDRDAACENSKSCFPSPAECSTDCNYLVTWSMAGTDDVEFTLKRKITNNDKYIAIGFSDDAKMGNDSVVHCVIQNSNVEVMASFNPSVYNDRLTDIKFGLSQDSGSFANGILSCTFRRKLNAAMASAAASSGRRRRAVSDGTTFFDLNNSWHLFVAHGDASSGYLLLHVETPAISLTKIDFLQMLIHPTTPTPTDSGTITKDNGCGSTVGCFSDCDSGSCNYLLTWKDSGDSVNFTLTCKTPGNSYCAIGLSDDDKMGDDYVFECIATASSVSVQQSFNDGKSNSPLDNAVFGLSVDSRTYQDGIIYCAFSRKKNFDLATAANSGSRKKRAATTSSTYFDMNNDYTLMFAKGLAIGGSILKHSSVPPVSSQKADFQDVKDLSSVESSRTLIKLHGTFMSVAWMVLATVGIFMARFYKPLWTGPDEDCCGLKRWFVVHRTCMVLVFLLTSVSFVIIFVHVEGYSEIVGTNFEMSHPILGIVVMALTVINPIMAMFRPNPGTPKRTVFNIGHTFVGWSAHICGIVNLFSGTMLSATNMDSDVRNVLWGFVGLVLFVTIVCQIYDSIVVDNLGFKSDGYELDQIDAPSKEEKNKSPPSQTFKLGLLFVNILGLVGLSIAVVVLIWMA